MVTTDHKEYRLGATVHILGSGFASGETVTVKVSRTSFFAENGPAFDPFVVAANASGQFDTPWVLADGLGVNFLVSAVGAVSGAAAERAQFHRGAEVTTDRRYYGPGNTAIVSGAGFRPGGPVTVSMEAAQPTVPGPVTADAQGRFSATFNVDANPSAPSHRVRAFGPADANTLITAITGFADGGVTVVDDGGPEDVPHTGELWRQTDLTYYRSSFRKDISPRVLDITIGWNATWISFGTYNVLLDTNNNGRIDRRIHGELDGDPDPISAVKLAFVEACNDTSATVCVHAPITGPAIGVAYFKAAAGALAGNLVLPMVSSLGLPADGVEPTVLNVCNGVDCIVTPGNGFLTIEQVVPAGNGNGTFNFNLAAGTSQNGATGWAITTAAVSGGSFGTAQFISMAPGTYTLNDVVPAGWQVTAASCKSDTQTVNSGDPLPVASPGTVSVAGFSISPGVVTRCKFTASRFPAP